MKTQKHLVDMKLAMTRLELLADKPEAEFTKDDFDFLKTDLVGKLLQCWPDWFKRPGSKV